MPCCRSSNPNETNVIVATQALRTTGFGQWRGCDLWQVNLPLLALDPHVENENGARTIFEEGDPKMKCNNAIAVISVVLGTWEA